MALKCDYLQRSIQTLKLSLDMLHRMERGSRQHDVCRTTVLGSFELCLKRSDALLQKVLVVPGGGIGRLSWQQIVQESARQSLIPADESARWVVYHEKCHYLTQKDDQSFEGDVLPIIEEFYERVCRLLERIVQLQKTEELL